MSLNNETIQFKLIVIYFLINKLFTIDLVLIYRFYLLIH